MSWQESMKALFRPKGKLYLGCSLLLRLVQFIAGAASTSRRFAQHVKR